MVILGHLVIPKVHYSKGSLFQIYHKVCYSLGLELGLGLVLGLGITNCMLYSENKPFDKWNVYAKDKIYHSMDVHVYV